MYWESMVQTILTQKMYLNLSPFFVKQSKICMLCRMSPKLQETKDAFAYTYHFCLIDLCVQLRNINDNMHKMLYSFFFLKASLKSALVWQQHWLAFLAWYLSCLHFSYRTRVKTLYKDFLFCSSLLDINYEFITNKGWGRWSSKGSYLIFDSR